MQLLNRSPKKSEIAKLLEIQDPINTAKLESSAVARAAFTAMPGVLKHFSLILFLCIAFLILALVILVSGASQERMDLFALGTVGVFLSLGALTVTFIRSSNEKRIITNILEAALSELKTLNTHLTSYLETIDKRTNRFFHCVTTSKVTTYYLLNQLQDELGRAIETIDSVFQSKNAVVLNQVLHLLQGNIVVSDGLVAEAGKTHEINFYNIKTILAELEEKMESGIQEIEQEIISFRNPPGDDSGR